MPALLKLLAGDQLAALTRLQVQLITTTAPPPVEPTAPVCPTCGRPKPVPAAADGAVPGLLAAAVGADHAHLELGGDQVLEVAAGEALVPDQDHPRPQCPGTGGVR
jgi:hypothetical protein